MKFGKQLQAELIPGWSEYYLDYKFLKKIVSSLASNRPASEAAALALGIRVRPADLLAQEAGTQTATPAPSPHPPPAENVALMTVDEPPLMDQDDDYRGPDFQAHKAAFFFKLERELEKVRTDILASPCSRQMSRYRAGGHCWHISSHTTIHRSTLSIFAKKPNSNYDSRRCCQSAAPQLLAFYQMA
ncbi:hypothetical protein PENSPDRAFT_370465 [Peniophora sp. CONT]|nr:hypothetical protein PENSPDRAFT_370465 [Peniophora sp. CONT]